MVVRCLHLGLVDEFAQPYGDLILYGDQGTCYVVNYQDSVSTLSFVYAFLQ